MNTGIFIPVRMGSTRLPNKPTALIANKPMMIWVGEQAKSAKCGDVIFACADDVLVELAHKHGFQAVRTEPNLPSGTDAVHAASKIFDKKYDIVVNLQGDMPAISPDVIKKTVECLQGSKADIATAVAKMSTEQERTSPNVVKAIIAYNGRALYFTRTSFSPYGDGDHYHHIGIYAFTRESIDKFVSLPQTPLEKRERLEQLRALENGMVIAVTEVSSAPHGVDTPDDLEYVRTKMSA